MCAMITYKPLWGQGEGVDQEWQADLDFSRITEALPFLSPLSPHQRKSLGSWPPASLGHTCSDRSMTWNKLPSSPPSVIIGKFPVHRQLPVWDKGCLLAGFLWVLFVAVEQGRGQSRQAYPACSSCKRSHPPLWAACCSVKTSRNWIRRPRGCSPRFCTSPALALSCWVLEST